MEKAGDLLKLFLNDRQFEEGRRWTAFFNSWRRILGDRLSAHSRVRDVKSGTVIVEVDHPGWIQMLQMKQRQILKEVNRLYPELSIHSMHIQLSERKFWVEGASSNGTGSSASGTEGHEPAGASGDEKAVSPDEERREPADRRNRPPDEEVRGSKNPLDKISDGNFRSLLARLEKSIRQKDRQ